MTVPLAATRMTTGTVTSAIISGYGHSAAAAATALPLGYVMLLLLLP